MTLNGEMAIILRNFAEFGGQLRNILLISHQEIFCQEMS